MFSSAAEILSEHIKDDTKVGVAVSGGKDSMCLLDFVLRFSGIDKSRVVVVNIDHKIRGESSARDSRFVKDYCAEKGVEFRGFCVDVPALCAESGRSEETEAREARRDIFARLVSSGAADVVLTAHHALDNVETVLMHLFRGSGINGLRGMDVLSRGFVLRPLLYTEKSEIDEYAQMYSVPFVTDETNADTKYNRNFVRGVLLPLISSRWGGVERAVTELSREARETTDFLDSIAGGDAIKFSDCSAEIDAGALGNSVLAPRIVMRALKSAGLSHDMERKHIDEIAALKNGKTGAAVDLPHGFRAEKSYGKILIFKPSDKKQKSDAEVPFALGKTYFCGYSVMAQVADKADFSQKGALYIDADALPKGACIRFRRDGDRFRPFGGGDKKLKEWLIDKKIPVSKRDSLPLLCGGNTVFAVLGTEISDLVKVNGQTKKIIRITVDTEE